MCICDANVLSQDCCGGVHVMHHMLRWCAMPCHLVHSSPDVRQTLNNHRLLRHLSRQDSDFGAFYSLVLHAAIKFQLTYDCPNLSPDVACAGAGRLQTPAG